MLMGELSLDGQLQRVRGVLPMALTARQENFTGLILPAENAMEAAVVEGIKVIGVCNLMDVVGFLNGSLDLKPVHS